MRLLLNVLIACLAEKTSEHGVMPRWCPSGEKLFPALCMARAHSVLIFSQAGLVLMPFSASVEQITPPGRVTRRHS